MIPARDPACGGAEELTLRSVLQPRLQWLSAQILLSEQHKVLTGNMCVFSAVVNAFTLSFPLHHASGQSLKTCGRAHPEEDALVILDIMRKYGPSVLMTPTGLDGLRVPQSPPPPPSLLPLPLPLPLSLPLLPLCFLSYLIPSLSLSVFTAYHHHHHQQIMTSFGGSAAAWDTPPFQALSCSPRDHPCLYATPAFSGMLHLDLHSAQPSGICAKTQVSNL